MFYQKHGQLPFWQRVQGYWRQFKGKPQTQSRTQQTSLHDVKLTGAQRTQFITDKVEKRLLTEYRYLYTDKTSDEGGPLVSLRSVKWWFCGCDLKVDKFNLEIRYKDG